MAFKLTAYTRQSGELTDNGTIAQLVGKKGSISFIRKNLNDVNKRVALLLKDEKGNSGVVSCSAQLSKEIRANNITIHEIAGLSLLENEDGVTFVSMPATGAIQEIAMKDIKVVSYERSEEFLPEELLAL
jgi:tetrahydromethanopterin S-methyltransferase subunit F